MPTRDLSAFLDDDSLTYPGIRSRDFPDGKTYKVASPDAKTGLRLASIGELGMMTNPTAEDMAKLNLSDDDERNLYQQVLGEAFDEMVADGVKWAMLRHVAQDAFLTWAISPETADAVLASRGNEVALANRAEKRAATKAKKSGKKASTTPRTRRSSAGSNSNPASTPAPARRTTRKATPATGASSTSPSAPGADTAKAV